jgi:hypothetical protein
MARAASNLAAVLASMAAVPGIAALQQGASGHFDGNLTVPAVCDALQRSAPWASLIPSDRTADAYTPLSETSERALFQSATSALVRDVRTSLKMRM